MNKEYETIKRIDGITYKRKKKEAKYDKTLHIRFPEDKLEQLKEIANNNNIKYNQLIRNIILEYIDSCNI